MIEPLVLVPLLNVSSTLNVCESIISVTIQSIVVAGAVTLIKFNSSPTFKPLTNSAFSQYINELTSKVFSSTGAKITVLSLVNTLVFST